jgi:tetratricopeptide (TPR) repeat protein
MNRLASFGCALLLLFTVSGAGTVAAHPGNQQKLDYINQQLTASPSSARWYLQRAKLLLEDGHYDAALADITRAEQLGEAINAALLKAQLYSRQGQTAAAISAFNRYVQHFPNDVFALQGRAEASQQVGDIQSARRDYQRVLAISLYPSPGLYLATAKLALLAGDRDEALAIIDSATVRIGITPPLQQYAIQLEVTEQHWPEALQRLQALAPMQQKSPAWHIQQAELLIKAQRLAAAEQALAKAEQLLSRQRLTPQAAKLNKHMVQLRKSL